MVSGQRESVAYDDLSDCGERREDVIEHMRRGSSEETLARFFTRKSFRERLRVVVCL